MVIDGDATGTSEQLAILPEMNHTIPTQAELDAQAKVGTPLIGIHRRGECSCEVRLVEDGFAFRPYGSAASTPWQWLRTADFTRDFLTISIFDDSAMVDLIIELRDQISLYRRRARLCYKAMGPKSRERLARRLEQGNF